MARRSHVASAPASAMTFPSDPQGDLPQPSSRGARAAVPGHGCSVSSVISVRQMPLGDECHLFAVSLCFGAWDIFFPDEQILRHFYFLRKVRVGFCLKFELPDFLHQIKMKGKEHRVLVRRTCSVEMPCLGKITDTSAETRNHPTDHQPNGWCGWLMAWSETAVTWYRQLSSIFT